MTAIARTTELEAVNTMLSCISEAPVNDIDVTGLLDLDIAKQVLNEVSREVQTNGGSGWHWNSETDYPLIRDSNSKISVPDNVLKFDTTEKFRYGYDVVQRGGFLYNKKTRSFVFDKDIEVDVVWLFTFEDIPEAARRYIMIRAARIFQARQLGSDTQYKFSADEEMKAQSGLMGYEGETGDYNFLDDSASVATIARRVF
jgi:hypothetical protein